MKPKRGKSNQTLQRRQPQVEDAASEHVLSTVRHEMTISSGPIPAPEILKAYEDLVPGSAKQIIDVFVDQARNRQLIEHKMADASIRLTFQGQWLGFIIALVSIGAFLISALVLHTLLGLVGIFAAIAALAGVFALSSINQTRERIEKMHILAGDEEDN